MRQTLATLFLCLVALLPASAQTFKTLDDINIRDPFIYADSNTKTYYLYQTKDTVIDGRSYGGVIAWRSADLQKWLGPIRVFTCPKDNFLNGYVWAPEMHAYDGKYYLFLTINSDIKWKASQKGWGEYNHRVVQVMRADSPEGPFAPMSDMPTTPIDQMALDGTLYVEDGTPYMVYCNEWIQRVDGTYRLAQLTPDLSRTVDDGHDLFCASAIPWGTGSLNAESGIRSYVSDGCFLWRTSKKLLMLVSSFGKDGYAVGVAESLTGKITGPWLLHDEPLTHHDGGHGMIFRDFSGQPWLLIHSPNSPSGQERAKLLKVEETSEGDIKVDF